MARFILKWRYIREGSKKHNCNLVKYIATRDEVEKCDESWKTQPATVEQKRLIDNIRKDFPNSTDSFEYQDYMKEPNKYTASQFISQAIEENIDLIGKKNNYVKYIAMRPRVEKEGTHGLFSQDDKPISLSKVAKEVAEHKGLVWTTIMSLRREDAEKLCFDNAKAWKDMLRGKVDSLAKHMGIPLNDLRWYAAFHNEGSHPHIHLVSYSVGKTPYMSEEGLLKFKSEFAREIFKQDLYHIYDEQTVQRDKLRQESKERIAQIVSKMNSGVYQTDHVESLLTELSQELKSYNGKKVYGYLPKRLKNLVDGIVDEIAKDSRIRGLYDLWYEQRENVIKIYQDSMPDRIPLSKNNEFKTIRNAVLLEAFKLSGNTEHMDEDRPKVFSASTEENESVTPTPEPISWDKRVHNPVTFGKFVDITSRPSRAVGLATLRLFARISQIIGDSITDDGASEDTVDRKLRQVIREKKQAHGQKMG